MTPPLRILFLGSGAFGLPSLQALCRHHDVVGVVSQPDRRAGRGRTPTPTPITQHALEHDPAPLFRPDNINEPGVIDTLRALRADAWVVIAFGQKLSQDLLQDQFACNLHASLLPRWRGASPINAAIVARDTLVGNTIITIAERMDAGEILGSQSIERDPMCNAGELHDRLAQMGPDLILDVLAGHATGMIQPQPQDESLVTHAPKLSTSDGWIDLARPAEECQARVHGLSPWPGVRVHLDDQPLKLCRVGVAPASPTSAPGTLLDSQRGLVACGDNTALELLEIQPPGKRIMAWADYARGRSLPTDGMLQGITPPC
ncbi:MAG: methionyl-tRNA formyltransferase [Phycisphaerales bacterium JB043]